MDLLEEARLRYPPGTVYYCDFLKKEFTIKNNTILRYHRNKHEIDASGIGFVYFHGVWSPIIKSKVKLFIGLDANRKRKR